MPTPSHIVKFDTIEKHLIVKMKKRSSGIRRVFCKVGDQIVPAENGLVITCDLFNGDTKEETGIISNGRKIKKDRKQRIAMLKPPESHSTEYRIPVPDIRHDSPQCSGNSKCEINVS